MKYSEIRFSTPEEAIQSIQSGQRVFIHGSAHTPLLLLHELAKQAKRLQNVELVSISLYGDIEVDKPEYSGSFHINSMFVSESIRQAVNEGRADYIPVFLSEIPYLFNSGLIKLDAALLQVSMPDKHGYCSLGVSVDIARAAVHKAKNVIAILNPNAPRTHGDGMVHISKFNHVVFNDAQLFHKEGKAELSEIEHKIGEHIASMIEDRSCLQMGIGAIPDAVLHNLQGHKDLGIHTEMCSDGIIELMQKGIITNACKKYHPHKSVVGFALGTQQLYDFINDNPAFAFLDISYINNPNVIKRLDKMIAINSAVEVDITGQVCADSIGTYQYSGVGGQMDFMRGAALSEGGKPIIALPSRTSKGLPRIVPILKPGANVVTTRAHVHYIVTEYGIAFLQGKNLRQRAKALIEIAHPDDREELERACMERFKIF